MTRGPGRGPRRARGEISRRALALGTFALVALVGVAAWALSPRSRDTGAIGVLQTADFHALAFSPSDPNVVFFGHHNGLMRSTDGGRTWQPLAGQLPGDVMAIASAGGEPETLHAAGMRAGLPRSADGGGTWGSGR